MTRHIEELKTQFVANMLVGEIHQYQHFDNVFSVAKKQSIYLQSKNGKQRNFNF